MAAATALLAATSTLAEPIPNPVAAPAPATPTSTTSPIVMGCYSSHDSLTFQDTNGFQTSGLCVTQCVPLNHAVIAINGTDCWCGDTMPPLDTKVADSFCDTPCPGYGSVNCGSTDSTQSYFTVWNAGLKNTISNAADSSSSASASSSSSSSSPAPSTSTSSVGSQTASASPSVVTIGGQTIVVTASSTPTSTGTNSGSSSGPSKAGIAAGVVVGVVAIAAIAGGVFLFIRSRRRREVEEEFKRQAAMSSFAASKPGSSGGHSIPDSRLDPAVLNQRRLSDGSIADNQDYSRRILKVTNA